MRFAFFLSTFLSLEACTRYETQAVTPASRNETSFTYNDRPMTLIWETEGSLIIPRTSSKVLRREDLTGTATITYLTGPPLTPNDAAEIVKDVLGCHVAQTAPGYGRDGIHRTISVPMFCNP